MSNTTNTTRIKALKIASKIEDENRRLGVMDVGVSEILESNPTYKQLQQVRDIIKPYMKLKIVYWNMINDKMEGIAQYKHLKQ